MTEEFKQQIKDTPPLKEDSIAFTTGKFSSGREMKIGDKLLFGTVIVSKTNAEEMSLNFITFHEEEIGVLYELVGSNGKVARLKFKE